jgi:hypothetical protein
MACVSSSTARRLSALTRTTTATFLAGTRTSWACCTGHPPAVPHRRGAVSPRAEDPANPVAVPSHRGGRPLHLVDRPIVEDPPLVLRRGLQVEQAEPQEVVGAAPDIRGGGMRRLVGRLREPVGPVEDRPVRVEPGPDSDRRAGHPQREASPPPTRLARAGRDGGRSPIAGSARRSHRRQSPTQMVFPNSRGPRNSGVVDPETAEVV